MKKTITLLILFFCCAGLLRAQEKDIRGKITSSEDGQPLPGVSIIVKGTSNGTSSNSQGESR